MNNMTRSIYSLPITAKGSEQPVISLFPLPSEEG